MNNEKVEQFRDRLSKGQPISLRATEEDRELLVKIYARKGLDLATIYRLGLRAYAELERIA